MSPVVFGAKCGQREAARMEGCSSTSPGLSREFPTPPYISRGSFPACIPSLLSQLAVHSLTDGWGQLLGPEIIS